MCYGWWCWPQLPTLPPHSIIFLFNYLCILWASWLLVYYQLPIQVMNHALTQLMTRHFSAVCLSKLAYSDICDTDLHFIPWNALSSIPLQNAIDRHVSNWTDFSSDKKHVLSLLNVFKRALTVVNQFLSAAPTTSCTEAGGDYWNGSSFHPSNIKQASCDKGWTFTCVEPDCLCDAGKRVTKYWCPKIKSFTSLNICVGLCSVLNCRMSKINIAVICK